MLPGDDTALVFDKSPVGDFREGGRQARRREGGGWNEASSTLSSYPRVVWYLLSAKLPSSWVWFYLSATYLFDLIWTGEPGGVS